MVLKISIQISKVCHDRIRTSRYSNLYTGLSCIKKRLWQNCFSHSLKGTTIYTCTMAANIHRYKFIDIYLLTIYVIITYQKTPLRDSHQVHWPLVACLFPCLSVCSKVRRISRRTAASSNPFSLDPSICPLCRHHTQCPMTSWLLEEVWQPC